MRALLAAIFAFTLHINAMSQSSLLKVGDVGPYVVQASKQNPEGLALVYVPGLAALLARAEKLKGHPLSEAESKRIADDAEAIAVPKAIADKTIAERGYK